MVRSRAAYGKEARLNNLKDAVAIHADFTGVSSDTPDKCVMLFCRGSLDSFVYVTKSGNGAI